MMYSRKDLPQLTEELLKEKELSFSHEIIEPWHIHPVQRDKLNQTVKRFLRVARNTYRPLIVDKNYFLVDGHHRLDLLLKGHYNVARIIKIDSSLEEILEVFKK